MSVVDCALCMNLKEGICKVKNLPLSKLTGSCDQRIDIIEAGQKTLKKALRYKELLNNVINHLSVGESNSNLIDKLLDIGFTKEELVEHFNFNKEDVYDSND